MSDNQSKASKEGYSAGISGESSDSNPYKSDGVIERGISILTDVVTGNAFNTTAENDKNAAEWQSAHGAGSNDKGKEK